MFYRGKTFCGLAADALGRRIRRDHPGIRAFNILQLSIEFIIFLVRNPRSIFDIIEKFDGKMERWEKKVRD